MQPALPICLVMPLPYEGAQPQPGDEVSCDTEMRKVIMKDWFWPKESIDYSLGSQNSNANL